MTDELFREDATLALCDARVVAVGEGGVILARGSILARVARVARAEGARVRSLSGLAFSPDGLNRHGRREDLNALMAAHALQIGVARHNQRRAGRHCGGDDVIVHRRWRAKPACRWRTWGG